MYLKDLLAGNPAWNDTLAEQVLAQYLKLRQNRIEWAVRVLGHEEVAQLLRLRMWRLWLKFEPDRGTPLYKWLQYNLDKYLNTIHKVCLRHTGYTYRRVSAMIGEVDDAANPTEDLPDTFDWWEQVQLALVRSALQQLSPEEEYALWQYADGAKLSPQQRRLAEQAVAKVRQLLNLEP